MKQLLMIIMLFAFIGFSCGGGSSKYSPQPPDTVKTFGIWHSKPLNRVEYGIKYRISKDSFAYVYADTLENNKRKWRRISVDYLPFTDTMRDKKTGAPVLDSLKRPVFITNHWPASVLGTIIYDVPLDLDSLDQVYTKPPK